MTKNLLSSITPDIGAIFWITDKPIAVGLEHYNDFDYVYDGLISHYLFENKTATDCTSFCTQSFGKPLWLIHIGPNAHSGSIDEQFFLLNKDEFVDKKILIISHGNKKWEQELPKRYPKFQFVIF